MEMVQEVYKIRTDVEADAKVAEIRDLQAERQRFEMIYKARLDQLKADFEKQVSSIDKEIEFDKSMLQAYFNTVPAKATKTQRTYKLLSGKLVMKNPTVKLGHDDKTILEWAKESGKEYIKQEPKLDWSKLKEDLEIKGELIINKNTGEVIECEGLRVEHINEQFEIKL